MSRVGPQRLLILVTQLERGGAQKIALDLAGHCAAEGHAVTLCYFYSRSPLPAALRAQTGLTAVDLGARAVHGGGGGRLWRAAGALWRLWRLLRRTQPDVVLTFTHYSNLLGPPLAWLAGVERRIASARSLLADRPAWFTRLHGLVLNSRAVDRVIAVSEPVRQVCIVAGRVRPEKVQVIHNGVARAAAPAAPRAALGLPPAARVILTVARLEAQKGHAILLDAAEALRADFPALLFLWAGDGPERARLAAQIAATGLDVQVRLLGSRADVGALLAAADLFVLPSLAEGLPNALLEAMAAGVPVVATAAGGIPTIVTSGVEGLLVPVGDPLALAAALRRLLTDPPLAAALARRGEARVAADFSRARMLAAYEALLFGER